MNNYKDIIDVPRPISKRPRMSLYNRSGQFSPFAALTGFEDIIDESNRETLNKIEISDYENDILNEKLNNIDYDKTYKIKYFIQDKYKSGGSYGEIISKIRRIDEVSSCLIFINKEKISLSDIVSIEEV